MISTTKIHYCERALNPYDQLAILFTLSKNKSNKKVDTKTIEDRQRDNSCRQKQQASTAANLVEMNTVIKTNDSTQEDEDFVLVDDGSFPILNNNGSVIEQKKEMTIFDYIIFGKTKEVLAIATRNRNLLSEIHPIHGSALHLAINQNETEIAIALLEMNALILTRNKQHIASFELRNAYLNTQILEGIFK